MYVIEPQIRIANSWMRFSEARIYVYEVTWFKSEERWKKLMWNLVMDIKLPWTVKHINDSHERTLMRILEDNDMDYAIEHINDAWIYRNISKIDSFIEKYHTLLLSFTKTIDSNISRLEEEKRKALIKISNSSKLLEKVKSEVNNLL